MNNAQNCDIVVMHLFRAIYQRFQQLRLQITDWKDDKNEWRLGNDLEGPERCAFPVFGWRC
jgi:hypothetical protein